MQGPQQQQYPMSNADLWDAVQRQQQSAQQAGGPYGAASMAPLPSFELPHSAAHQSMVLPGKPLPQTNGTGYHPQQQLHGGGGNMGGFAGVSSSLTSLPPMSQPYGSLQQAGGGGMSQQHYPQLSGSQVSSGMALGSGGMVPTPAPAGMALPVSASGAMMHSTMPMPMPMPVATQPMLKLESDDPSHPSSSHSAAAAMPMLLGGGASDDDGEGSPSDCVGSGGLNKSRYRGVSYDRKKAKWRVQIKVAALGKSGVSVGYFDTEEAAARAYDRAAIGLLGRDNPNLQTNFDARDYTGEAIPPLTGKSREEVKTTLKSERIKQAPRRRFTSRQRTSRFMGVGSSNRKNQWQARILVHGKVTHLGYYETEEEAARVYDKVSLALHGDSAQTNFAASNYSAEEVAQYTGLDRENLQRALGVKPMDKSSRFRGVSKKKGKWEAKVMVNRRWAYRELFDSEEEAARAYDRALWRLKPKEAHSYVNFKDEVPPEVAHLLGDEGGSFTGGGGGRARSRAAALASSDEDEASDGSEGLSEDEEGSGGTPRAYQPPRTSRSGRRLRATGSPVVAQAPPRAASAPNLHAAAAQQQALQQRQMQQQMQQQQAAMPSMPGMQAPSGFVAMPGGGLQLQFGGGAGGGGFFGAPLAPPAPAMPGAVPPSSAPMLPPTSAPQPQGMPGQPLLVRVGSETHLIPHQQQQPAAPAAPRAHAAPAMHMAPAFTGGSSLGKRMSRIQSEPTFVFHKEDSGGSAPGGDLPDLMSDRELFRALELGEDVPSTGAHGGTSVLDSLGDLETGDLLDFIKDMPDSAPVYSAGAGAGRGAAGMFKSRSMGNLMDLSGPFFDEEDEALAGLEFARPRKISKSMSMTQLAGMDAGGSPAGAAPGRPPLPPGGSPPDAGKLGPLGKPIRRTNTFSSSLAVLQEADREGRAAEDPLGQGGMGSHHSSADDLVQRLLAPSVPSAEDDAMLADLLQ